MRTDVVKLAAIVAAVAGGLSASANTRQASGAGAIEYEFLRGGSPFGRETVVRTPGGVRVRFATNRPDGGWRFDETITLNTRGVPTDLVLTGVDQSGHPVSDRYQRIGQTATWTNFAGRGSSSDASRVYLSMPILEGQITGVPEELGLLARALLAAPGRTLRLSPAGAVTLRSVGTVTVVGRQGERALDQFEIMGLDYAPVQVWLDADRTLFAVFTGGTLVRAGWSDVAPALLSAQAATLEADAERTAPRPRTGAFAFVHARVFDPRTESTRPSMTVLVKGRTIAAVEPDGAPLGADVATIDAHGDTLLPGLWDMHTHLTRVDGLLHMSAGVTTVRDLGNDVDQVLAMQRDFETGRAIGPRVFLAGLIDGRGPYQGPTKLLVDDEAEARATIDLLARDKFDQVKVYGSIKAALVPYIARLAHERGLRVGGHIPAFMTARQAVEAGYDEINHINYMFLNFMPDVVHLESPERVTATAERAATIDLASPEVREFVRFLKQHGTIVDPTLSTWETRLLASVGQVDPAVAPQFDRLPAKPRRAALRAGLASTATVPAGYPRAFQAVLDMDRLLYDAGITLVTGSDGLARFGYDRELELEVEAGIPPARVLAMATLGAATVMHRERDLGTIEVGKSADMVLVSGSPDRHIGDIRRPRYVSKEGKLYAVADLERVVGLRD
jgi:hypothetical protein